ncbi:MAG: insulinase family protein, partial [Bacteroidetes bacterium]
NSISLYYKHPVAPVTTLPEYRANLIRNLASRLISDRLDELGQQDNPPFSLAYSRYSNMVRTKDNYVSGAYVDGDGFLTGFRALLEENERARRYGFTETELERAKRSILTSLEKQYRERDKIESRQLVMSFVYHFLEGSPATGVEQALALHRNLLPGISLEEVNAAFRGFIREDNRVITIMAGEKEGVEMPAEADLRAMLEEVSQWELAPYEDKVADVPLMSEIPQAGSVVAVSERPELGVTEWTLSNGARVILKPTNFKNDEIGFSAFSPGGTSLYPDSLYMSANEAADIISSSGLGSYDNIQLEKYLSDKVLRIRPYIGELEEGFQGSCSPRDLETFMQLVHLYFVRPRKDPQAFASMMTRNKSLYANLLASPQYWFRSELTKAINQNHFRRDFIPGAEKLDMVDLDQAYQIYQERFADAGDFTFLFVGNVSPETLQPLVETYIASLPGLGREEVGQDVGVQPPATPLSRTFYKGSEPQSQVVMRYLGDFTWNTENRFNLKSAVQVLSIMMRESMREEQGGVYGVGASPSFERDPKPRYSVNISFTCAPENVETLMETVETEAGKLREEGPSEKNLAKIKEIMRKELEVDMKQNGYWMEQLRFAYRYGLDPARILEAGTWIEDLSAADIQAAAQTYLQPKQLASFVLNPEPEEN